MTPRGAAPRCVLSRILSRTQLSTVVGPYDGKWQMQSSLLSVDATAGELAWAKSYEVGLASHPYAMTLSSPHDPVPGYVIAGHAVGVQPQPIGRLLKARASDGALVWHRTFIDRDPRYWNIECYGVDGSMLPSMAATS